MKRPRRSPWWVLVAASCSRGGEPGADDAHIDAAAHDTSVAPSIVVGALPPQLRELAPEGDGVHPSCATPPLTDRRFASFDDVASSTSPGIRAELGAMDDGAAVRTQILGASIEGRDVVAVRFGRDATGVAPRPTVYVLATYHANEWVGEEVAMRLARWAHRALLGASSPYGEHAIDPELAELLRHASLTIVPVANPDGYQFARTPGRFRDWRKNRRKGTCLAAPGKSGVDLNRNHHASWDARASDVPAVVEATTDGCSSTYRGATAASEPEIQAIERLLAGNAFDAPQLPAVTLSFHSYADVAVWPNGVSTKPGTPRCEPVSGCLAPDELLFRRLFDDDTQPFLRDASGVVERRYGIGPASSISAPNAGNSALQGVYGEKPHLSLTLELTGENVGFHLECAPDPEAILGPLLAQQQTLVKELLRAAPALTSTTERDAFAASTLGVVTAGTFVREASDDAPFDRPRARFFQGVWLGADAIPRVSASGLPSISMHDARVGAHEHAYYLDAAELDPAGSSLSLPCSLDTAIDGKTVRTATACTGRLDLCDPARFSATGWQLHDEPRDGARDCWWEPEAGDAEVVLSLPGIHVS
jgi:hypothetical protein